MTSRRPSASFACVYPTAFGPVFAYGARLAGVAVVVGDAVECDPEELHADVARTAIVALNSARRTPRSVMVMPRACQLRAPRRDSRWWCATWLVAHQQEAPARIAAARGDHADLGRRRDLTIAPLAPHLHRTLVQEAVTVQTSGRELAPVCVERQAPVARDVLPPVIQEKPS